MKIESFFRKHPIFTRSLFNKEMGGKNKNTLKNMLAHHLSQGHIVRIKRGLFASIPYGANHLSYPINPYLIASNLADKAVIGYHTALSYYGLAYSSSYRFIYISKAKPEPLSFMGVTYQPTLFPAELLSQGKSLCYVNKEDVQGMNVLVTSIERTMVDVMDRPLLGGGWEEIWRSLDMIEQININDVINYALTLKVATTIAKVGFYLEQRKNELGIDDSQLGILEQHCPVSPHYMDNTNKKGESKLASRWNLMVPKSITNRDWEERLNRY